MSHSVQNMPNPLARGYSRALIPHPRARYLVPTPQSIRDLQDRKDIVTGALRSWATTTPEDDDKCPICLEQFLTIIPSDSSSQCPVPESPVRTPCQHYFGHLCLGAWLDTSDTCPMCRTQLIWNGPADVTEQQPDPLTIRTDLNRLGRSNSIGITHFPSAQSLFASRPNSNMPLRHRRAAARSFEVPRNYPFHSRNSHEVAMPSPQRFSRHTLVGNRSTLPFLADQIRNTHYFPTPANTQAQSHRSSWDEYAYPVGRNAMEYQWRREGYRPVAVGENFIAQQQANPPTVQETGYEFDSHAHPTRITFTSDYRRTEYCPVGITHYEMRGQQQNRGEASFPAEQRALRRFRDSAGGISGDEQWGSTIGRGLRSAMGVGSAVGMPMRHRVNMRRERQSGFESLGGLDDSIWADRGREDSIRRG